MSVFIYMTKNIWYTIVCCCCGALFSYVSFHSHQCNIDYVIDMWTVFGFLSKYIYNRQFVLRYELLSIYK